MSGLTPRALVVDDDVRVRELCIRALEMEGISCEGASNGREAKEALSTNRFDVVVTDLRMPEINGHALALDILSNSNPPLLIVVTGVAEPRIARDLLSRGVDDVLYKPLDHDLLAMKIKSLIERREAPA